MHKIVDSKLLGSGWLSKKEKVLKKNCQNVKILKISIQSMLDQSLDLSFASSKREEQEVEEQREVASSPFISALSKTVSLWPEDEEKHKCPS